MKNFIKKFTDNYTIVNYFSILLGVYCIVQALAVCNVPAALLLGAPLLTAGLASPLFAKDDEENDK